MKDKVKLFIVEHRVDDILYAITSDGQFYFRLSDEEQQEITSFVFRAIRNQKELEQL